MKDALIRFLTAFKVPRCSICNEQLQWGDDDWQPEEEPKYTPDGTVCPDCYWREVFPNQ